jgi:Transposase
VDTRKSYLYGIELKFLHTRVWVCQIRRLLASSNVRQKRFPLLYVRLNALRDEGQTRPRSDRPPALSNLDRRNLLRIIRSNPKITYAILKVEAGVTVHRNTVYKLLKEEGISKWLAKKRPLLTPQVVTKRLAWAKAHANWTWDKWCKIIWSDECSLERGARARRLWVFRTPQQKCDKEMIQPYMKGKDISVMI